MGIRTSDIVLCFWQPGKPGIIDYVHPRTGYSAVGGKNLAEIQAEYPGARIANFDRVVEISEDYFRQPVRYTNETQYDEMLNCLPPVNWCRWSDGESFKMSERSSGNITGIYAHIGREFYHLEDSIFLSHDEIMRRCREFEAVQRLEPGANRGCTIKPAFAPIPLEETS